MEGWQKGAPAVLKFSQSGKKKYFAQFPERESWFRQNYPEHFGRSVTAATTSLKKVNKAKTQQQRLASIRQAAEKRDQLKVSSAAVQAMGVRRREGGEGLGGGLETNRDIIAHARAGGTIASGGLGSLFEQEKEQTKLGGYKVGDRITIKGKNGQPIDRVWNGTRWVSPDSYGTLPPDRSSGFRDPATGQSVDGVTKPLEIGLDWPANGKDATRWTAGRMRNTILTTDPETLAQLKADFSPKDTANLPPIASPEAQYIAIDTRKERPDLNKRRRYEDDEEYQGMYKEENELMTNAKELAEKVVSNKIQECMPMHSMPNSSDESKEEPGEYDYEGDMAKSQLRSIGYNAQMLHDMLEDNTNLPEWVQSKITLAEDYMLTAANYMRGELRNMEEAANPAQQAAIAIAMKKAGKKPKSMKEEAEQIDETKRMSAAVKLARALDRAKAERERSQQNAQELLKGGKDKKPMKEENMNDLVARSMLPDQSVIPAGQGFGDDIPAATLKNSKIMDKMKKIILKKKMGKPSNNPSENELVPRSMLPDVPGYPADYVPTPNLEESTEQEPFDSERFNEIQASHQQVHVPGATTEPTPEEILGGPVKEKSSIKTKNMKNYTSRLATRAMKAGIEQDNNNAEQMIRRAMEKEMIRTGVAEETSVESVSPYVSASASFLTNTSARLVYGDKND